MTALGLNGLLMEEECRNGGVLCLSESELKTVCTATRMGLGARDRGVIPSLSDTPSLPL